MARLSDWMGAMAGLGGMAGLDPLDPPLHALMCVYNICTKCLCDICYKCVRVQLYSFSFASVRIIYTASDVKFRWRVLN